MKVSKVSKVVLGNCFINFSRSQKFIQQFFQEFLKRLFLQNSTETLGEISEETRAEIAHGTFIRITQSLWKLLEKKSQEIVEKIEKNSWRISATSLRVQEVLSRIPLGVELIKSIIQKFIRKFIRKFILQFLPDFIREFLRRIRLEWKNFSRRFFSETFL